MTNHWIDLRNSDCFLVIGSNPAENHPISMKWVLKAKERGAKLVVVDPRFTRTASQADLYCPLRPGTDIAFIGGMIKYILDNNLFNREYVVEYTNASFLVSPEFSFHDGLFSGYNPSTRSYNKSSWVYQLDENGVPKRDKTLSDPNCVFQLLKRHYSRYDSDTVSRITGAPKDLFLKVAETYSATSQPGKAGTIMYAMGTTQHTVGTQNVRAYAILQLLLGNVGIPGGGVNAMRGESNVQGSTDFALLFHILPGYLRYPVATDRDLATYLKNSTPTTADPDSVNYWKNFPKFFISLMKAFFGDKATAANDFCYDYLPKAGGNYSFISLFEAMYEGVIKGLFLWGQNPCVGGPNANKEAKALENLDWMVAVDLWETDTAVFWKRPGVNPADIKTEVFLLPAAASFEKEGSVSNSGRWAQWRYKAVEPPGDAKSDLEIVSLLYKAIRDKYQGSTSIKDRPILDLTWNYGSVDHPDVHLVAKEINGYDLTTHRLLPSFASLKDDGSTSCGCWIYSGWYTEEGNMAARRDDSDPSGLGLHPRWSWCWPINRRILYNRASCDVNGTPWNAQKALVQWDEERQQWITYDVPDFVFRTATGSHVRPEVSAKSPFIMRVEGLGCIFADGTADGPFPEHYEPFESPVKNMLSSQQINPVIKIWSGDMNPRAAIGSADYPLIGTTYRVTEHWQAGAMTRNLPWLAELMPEMFVEISPELAKARGLKPGELVKVVSPRGEVYAKVCITERIKALKVGGLFYELVGMPWHYGFNGFVTGGKDRSKNYAANLLTAHIGDANTMIPEYKVFLCDIRKVM